MKRTAGEYVVRLRWPKGRKSCPGCHQAMGFVQTRHGFFNAIVAGSKSRRVPGTLFHQSRIPLQEVVLGDLSDGDHVQGVSMRYLQKHLGIKNYKTVWLMGHKIRQAMLQREGRYRLKGTVQVDEIKLGRQTLEDRRRRREDRRYPVPDGGPGRGHEGLPSVRDV